MKTTRHTPHLVRLTRLGAVNAYLVVEDDGLTLVDTMIPRSQDGILAAARDLGAPIVRIALTHAHGHHVGSLEVVAAPGHTPGHVAFLDTRDRTLIAGDAFSTLGGVETTAKVNPRFPLPALATWDRPTALRSAQALRELDPARLAVGHGALVTGPADAMDAAIARAGGR